MLTESPGFTWPLLVIDLDSKQLRSFLCLAAERSFSEAAKHVGCSQATMSVRIQKLEDLFGTRLFHRGPHEVQLTAEGRELLPDIRMVVDLQDRMYERMRSTRVLGKVRLGVADGYEAAILPGLLKYMIQNYATAELDIQCRPSWRLEQMINARTLDLAIVTLQEVEPFAVELCRAQLYWVAAPKVEFDPLLPLPVAWDRENRVLRSAAAAALKGQNIAYREILCNADSRVVQAAVESGIAVTVMVDGTVPKTLRVMSDPLLLPPLGKAPIQLLERPGLQSEASEVIKRKVKRAYQEVGPPFA